jgi:His-Xaa-Ser system protein HxsD
VETRIPASALQNVGARRQRVVEVCLRTFALDAIKKSCYRFSDRHFEELKAEEGGDKAKVTFSLPSTVSAQEEEALVQRFLQDVLDQDLRERIAEKTEVVRNLILAHAFANTALVESND